MDNRVERIEQQRLSVGAVMLEKVEGNTPILIQRDNLTVQQCTSWEPFAGTGDMRELRSEVVAPARSERYAALVPTS